MKIKIIAVGRKSSGWQKEGETDYLTRLKKMGFDVTVQLVSPENEEKIGSELASTREGVKILEKISEKEFVIACEPDGLLVSSPDFAARLGRLRDESKDACLLIGGSCGLSDAVLERADLEVSFSKMIWPHELFRVMLTEQLYRAVMILSGRKYHK